MRTKLLFGHLPGEDIAGLVLCAAQAEADASHAVNLALFAENGSLIAQKEVHLVGGQPFAALITTLFDGVAIPQNALIRAQGDTVLAEASLTLNGSAPFAALVSDFFSISDLPDHLSMIVEADPGTNLAGTTFVFNSLRQPSMAKALQLRCRPCFPN